MTKPRNIANLLSTCLVILVSTGFLKAHDTFLRADNFYVDIGEKAPVHLFTGSYTKSLVTFPPELMDTMLLGSERGIEDLGLDGVVRNEYKTKLWKLFQVIEGYFGGVSEHHTSTITLEPEEAGSYMLTFLKKTNRIVFTEETHNRYLLTEVGVNLEDFPFPLKNNDDLIRHRFIKTAKAVIQVGDKLTDNVTEPMDLIVEIVPAANPASIKVGDVMELQLRYDSKPAPNEVALAFDPKNKEEKQKFISDSDGRIFIPITDDGEWWVVYIHLEMLGGKDDVDFESWMTTLSFEIQ